MRALLPDHMKSVSVDSRMVRGLAIPSAGEDPVAVIDVEGLYTAVLLSVAQVAP